MKRAQIVCIGASSLYGVGGTKGSWADLFKQELHKTQYSPAGVGQVHEIYNLGIPGATIEDFLDRLEVDLRSTRKPDPNTKLITIFNIGGNNTMARGEPDNFVCSAEQYKKLVTDILKIAKQNSDSILWLGLTFMDQNKTMPYTKSNGSKIWCPNNRKIEFDQIAETVCKDLEVKFVSLMDKKDETEWADQYQYEDGIHPNDAGYQWMYEQIKPHILELLK